jgi:hypothetical protein
VRHVILTRSAYGSSWDLDSNRRRLSMTKAVTIPSLASQTSRAFRWIVLLHPSDPLLLERMAAYSSIGADFLFHAGTGTSAEVAASAYRAAWAEAIGPRDEVVAMTRLDDDDAFAPWAMAKVEASAATVTKRVALMFPLGIRVWDGGYTLVRHDSNAMQTLVTPPGDSMTVYDYLHRFVRRTLRVRVIDDRPAWLWSRHRDTISGWRMAGRALTPEIQRMFAIDWTIFGTPKRPAKATGAGARFR